mmetsp:Transcript_9993/g.25868  ORF Transcript_9993/g.25868 Transcript_9993/m.25868 type:complete len:440 (+) Transcript_9993:6-1325(+)
MQALKSLVSPRSSTPRSGTAGHGTTGRVSKAQASLTGWLYKKGEKNTAFKHRFFILGKGLLAYFDDEQATAAKGELEMLGATCEAVPGGTTNRFRFEVCVRDQGREGRTYVLEATDADTRDQWLTALLLSSTVTGGVVFPEGVTIDGAVGPTPERNWRAEWTSMRMETLRLNGMAERANRKECGPGGEESIDKWAALRAASISWKQTEGWAQEDAIAYTLVTACNGPALSRSLREKSGQYAASQHLIVRALATAVDRMPEPAPPLYYKLCGRNGLATVDSAWALLLKPGAVPGMRFVTTSAAVGRNATGCFPVTGKEKECKGFHDMFLAVAAGGDTQYLFDLCVSPVIKYVSRPTTTEGGGDGQPPATTTYHTLVKVDGHGNRWELPPLATITLESIEAAGTWGALEAEKVHRVCYTVSVSWTSSATTPSPGKEAVDIE